MSSSSVVVFERVRWKTRGSGIKKIPGKIKPKKVNPRTFRIFVSTPVCAASEKDASREREGKVIEAYLDLGRLEGGDGAGEGGSDASHC